MNFTGERYLPWVEDAIISYEHLHRYRFAKEFVKGKKVLDLASGEGYGSFMLSEIADFVVGVDIDEVSIKHASANYIKKNLEFIKGSIVKIPLDGKNIFDVIICFEAIEHIVEHDEMIKEVKRLLKDDGIFIVSTPNKYIYSDQANFRNPFHLKELYFDEFKLLLNNYFKNALIYGQKVYPTSNIFPLFRESKTSKDFVIEKGDREFLFLSNDRKLATYFIAITSDIYIDQNVFLGNTYLLDISDTLFRQRDVYIRNLEALIRARDVQIGQLQTHGAGLEALLKARDVQIGQLQTHGAGLEALLKARDTQIGQLESHGAGLEAKIMQLESQYTDTKITLDSIYISKGWKMLSHYYKVRDRLLPKSGRV